MAARQAWPLLEVLLEPRSLGDRAGMGGILAALLAEDLSLGTAPERNGCTILQGADEARLAVAVERLREGAAVKIGRPRVACREAILRRIEKDVTHRRRLASRGEFARVKMVFEPGEPGFVDAIVGGSVPAAFLPAVEASVGAIMRTGVLAGFAVVDTKVTLVDGAYHDRDSSVFTFATVARAAFTEAMDEAGGVVEPVMRVEVVAPRDQADSIIGDLVGRRGRILNRVICQDRAIIEAVAPLAELIGYDEKLRALSDGLAKHSLRFEAYWPIPGDEGPPPPAVAAAMRA